MPPDTAPDLPGTAADHWHPGELSFDAGGHPVSPHYGDIYKSRHGAGAESRHVFIDGNDLPERWCRSGTNSIIEIGFGLGVNCLETLSAWQAWRSGSDRSTRLSYVSVEAHPLSIEDLRRGLLALHYEPAAIEPLLDQWPMLTPGLHRIRLAHDVDLTLGFGTAAQVLPQLVGQHDTVYLDGFAPARNPAAWSDQTIRALSRLLRDGASLATYSAAASVRETLSRNGFEVRHAAGFRGKRHMLRAVFKPAAWQRRAPGFGVASGPPAQQPAGHDAIVLGAGLAGRAIARELIHRGWQIQLIDQHHGPVATQPVLASHIHFAPDDNPLARLTRAAFLMLARGLSNHGVTRRPGRLQLAADADEAVRLQAMVARLGLPADLLTVLNADAASDCAGIRLSRGGLWMPGSMVVEPERTLPPEPDGTRRVIDDEPDALRVHGGSVMALIRHGEHWQMIDAQGNRLASSQIVILCTGAPPSGLLPLASLDTVAIRGQTTTLHSPLTSQLRCVLSDKAYLCPLTGGKALAGASFDVRTESDPLDSDRQANLQRWMRLTGELPAGIRALVDHVGFRHTTRDHLPLIGPVPDEVAIWRDPDPWLRNDRLAIPVLPGLFMATCFGSRGLLWSTLAAQLLADLLTGPCLPVERTLIEQLAPSRMLRRLLRRHPWQVHELAASQSSPEQHAGRG